eukprot:56092_1
MMKLIGCGHGSLLDRLGPELNSAHISPRQLEVIGLQPYHHVRLKAPSLSRKFVWVITIPDPDVTEGQVVVTQQVKSVFGKGEDINIVVEKPLPTAAVADNVVLSLSIDPSCGFCPPEQMDLATVIRRCLYGHWMEGGGIAFVRLLGKVFQVDVISTTVYGGGQEGGKVCERTTIQVIDRHLREISNTDDQQKKINLLRQYMYTYNGVTVVGSLCHHLEEVQELAETVLVGDYNEDILPHSHTYNLHTTPFSIMLSGPSGVGKSLVLDILSRFCKEELNILCWNVHGPGIVLGIFSPPALRSLGKDHETSSSFSTPSLPPLLVTIDDADVLLGQGGEEAIRATNQLLKELQRQREHRSGKVLVIGATCMSSQDVWGAGIGDLASSSRKAIPFLTCFDRTIELVGPSQRDRQGILNGMLLKMHLDISKRLEIEKYNDIVQNWAWKLSETTPGFTGGDLRRLCRTAQAGGLARAILEKRIDEEVSSCALPSLAAVQWNDLRKAAFEVRPYNLQELNVSSQAEEFNDKSEGLGWKSVGGYSSVVKQLKAVVEWPWKKEKDFKHMGVKPTPGVLLYGPSGCGKTFLSQVLSAECRANFIRVSATDVLSPWLGEAENRIRQIFNAARRSAPSILFLDELDAVTEAREVSGSSSVYTRILSTLLNEMDGICTGTFPDAEEEGVIVLAATNRKEALDSALLRPGRLQEQIYVGLPSGQDRASIIHVHTRKMPLLPDIDLKEFGLLEEWTGGMTCAEVAAVCAEAGMMALRDTVEGTFTGKPPLLHDADIDRKMAVNLHVGYNHFALACKEITKRRKQLNNTVQDLSPEV